MFPAYLRDDGLRAQKTAGKCKTPTSHPSFPHTQEPTPRTPSNQHIPSPLRRLMHIGRSKRKSAVDGIS